MIAAGMSQRAHSSAQARSTERIVRLEGDLAGLLRSLAFVSAFVFAFAAGAMVFRLAVQLTATPPSGLVGIPYTIAGWFASPFHGFETTPSPPSTTVLEFSTLIALEAYLFTGLLVALVLVGLNVVVRRLPTVAWSFEYDLRPAIDTWHALDALLAGLSAEAGRAGSRWLSAVTPETTASREGPIEDEREREAPAA